MGAILRSLARRLDELERLSAVDPHAGEKEALAALTDEELRWVLEPHREAKARTACPQRANCECSCEARSQLALKTFPDLAQEFHKRYQEAITTKT